jgi:hypothetical protein
MGDAASDRESLDQIEALFSEKCSTPFDSDYDSTIETLSFTASHLNDADSSGIRRAWSQFLKGIFGVDSSWEWPCNVGMAEWYAEHDKPLHALAVYEHLLREVQKKGLDDSRAEYCDSLQEWLLRLFDLCKPQGLTERAIYVAELIGDFHEEGVIGLVEYAGVLGSIPALRRREVAEIIDRESAEAERRYREVFGELVDNLHDDTKRILIQAEVVGTETVRKIDPSAAPLCWSLAIESEFHHRVYEANKYRLDGILGRPRGRKTCGIGQILELVEKTCSDPIKRPLIEREIPAWRRLLAIPDIIEALNVIREHRDQIAHVTERGMYPQVRCNEFVRRIRESGWIVEFLKAIQSESRF